jgi:lipoate-protein ligase B
VRVALVVDLGLKNYEECWDLQRRIHHARMEELIPDCLLMVEHPHVFTIGRKGKKENVLVPESRLQQQGIPCLNIERGGDVTYHGPGQMVGYPIFGLGRGGVTDFVDRLEEVMILILKEYGITGERNERNRGVWVGNDKIGFVGIAIRKGVTFHGFALNVDPALPYFEMIHPCGLTGVKVTSMSQLLGKKLLFDEVKTTAVHCLGKVFELGIEVAELDFLLSKLPACKIT